MAICPRSTRLSYILTAGTTIFAAFLLALLLVPTSQAQASGSTKWLATFTEGFGGGPAAVAIDSQGNAYVTGRDLVSSNYCPPPESCSQAVTIKYSPSGKALWKDWLSTTNPGTAQGMNIAVDSAGNAYVLFSVTHYRSSDGVTIPEIITAKYNPAGGRDWINRIDSSHAVGGALSTPVQMVVSPAGNVYVLYDQVTPQNPPTTIPETAVTVKYDTAGHFIWSQTINDATGVNGGSGPNAIGLDASENVYVEVSLSSSTGAANGEIVKYNASGVRLASFGRGQISVANGLHVDPDGACYFSGSGATPANDILSDFTVAKFNPDQSLAYLVDITKLEGIGGPNGPPFGPDSAIGPITSDSAGNAFVLQHFDQTGPHGDGEVISVLKLDPSGKELFVTRYNPASDESGKAFPAALAVSPLGDFYVTGTSSPELPATGSAFVTVKYDNAGVRQWVAQYTGPSQNAGAQAMALSAGNLVVIGASNAENWISISYVP